MKQRLESALLGALVGTITGIVARTYETQPTVAIVLASAVIGAAIGVGLSLLLRR
jgi:hypothetical protein